MTTRAILTICSLLTLAGVAAADMNRSPIERGSIRMTGGRGEISSYGLTDMLMKVNNIKFGNPAVTGDNLKPYILSMSGDDAADPTATLMRGPNGALLVYDRFAVQEILLVLGFDAGDGMLHDASPWHRSPVSGRRPMAPMGVSFGPGEGGGQQYDPPTDPPVRDTPDPNPVPEPASAAMMTMIAGIFLHRPRRPSG